MKFIFSILSILIFISCSQSSKLANGKLPIDFNSVEDISIKSELYGSDSIHLSQQQTQLFVKNWNSSKSQGLYKMIPQFWVTVKLENDSIRRFRINGGLIKENSDWTYSLQDTSLIRSFWERKESFPNPK